MTDEAKPPSDRPPRKPKPAVSSKPGSVKPAEKDETREEIAIREAMEQRLVDAWRTIEMPPSFRPNLSRRGYLIYILAGFACFGFYVWALHVPSLMGGKADLVTQQEAPVFIGSIQRLRGEVKVREKRFNEAGGLKEGEEFLNNAQFETGPNSEAVLFFSSGTRVNIGAESVVMIRRPWQVQSGSEGLRRINQIVIVSAGQVTVEMRRSKDERIVLSVKTPTTVANVDSDFVSDEKPTLHVRVDPKSHESFFSVISGSFEIHSVDPSKKETLRLLQFHQLLVDEVGAFREPYLSIRAPKLFTPPQDFETKAEKGVQFGWSVVGSREMSYEFELSNDAQFEHLAFSAKVTEPTIRMETLDRGVYYWRVRARIESKLRIENPWSEGRSLAIR